MSSASYCIIIYQSEALTFEPCAGRAPAADKSWASQPTFDGRHGAADNTMLVILIMFLHFSCFA